MCGVFGVYGHPEAANITYLGLHALQHRGQESAGIVTSDGQQLSLHRGMGHVADVFSSDWIARQQGNHAIGHVRYSTAGGSMLKNAQPLAVDYSRGSVAVAHNGNLTNAVALRERLEERGSIFQSNSDALSQVRGAYSLLCLSEDKMIAVRDPYAIRPLLVGQVPGDKPSYVVASEPTSFDLIGAHYVREVMPGEMIVFDQNGMTSRHPFNEAPSRRCVFEYVYFARPDSFLDGISVYQARKNLGRALAREQGIEADLVIPVPDSGVPATIGYAEEAKIPFEIGLVRSHYVGRTFIEPQQSIRHFGVRLKLNPVSPVLRGKRVVVVDDSIVRGTTSRKIVKMLRDAGAKEVHMRISSPPTQWPCYYGIDTPTRNELIAASHSLEEINQYITSDTLGYLSLPSMLTAVQQARIVDTKSNGRTLPVVPPALDEHSFCHACFSGEYPIHFEHHPRPKQMRLLDM
jgi:amidophosphoribosyltransferase